MKIIQIFKLKKVFKRRYLPRFSAEALASPMDRGPLVDLEVAPVGGLGFPGECSD